MFEMLEKEKEKRGNGRPRVANHTRFSVLEGLTGKQLAIIGIIVFVLLFVAPRPLTNAEYASQLEQIISYLVTFLFLFYLLFLVFLAGFRQGTKLYKVPEEYLTPKQRQIIEEMLSKGKKVIISVEGPEKQKPKEQKSVDKKGSKK